MSTSVWIVMDGSGNDHFATSIHEFAKNRYQECIEDFPDSGPWAIYEYVPKRDLAAVTAERDALKEQMKFPPPKGTIYGDPETIKEYADLKAKARVPAEDVAWLHGFLEELTFYRRTAPSENARAHAIVNALAGKEE